VLPPVRSITSRRLPWTLADIAGVVGAGVVVVVVGGVYPSERGRLGSGRVIAELLPRAGRGAFGSRFRSGSESTRCLRLGADVEEEEDAGNEAEVGWEGPAAGINVGGGMGRARDRLRDGATRGGETAFDLGSFLPTT
jgi:hypothetical protein